MRPAQPSSPNAPTTPPTIKSILSGEAPDDFFFLGAARPGACWRYAGVDDDAGLDLRAGAFAAGSPTLGCVGAPGEPNEGRLSKGDEESGCVGCG